MAENSASREYIAATPEDRATFDYQLRCLYGQRSITLMGSVGRQALYAAFDWDVPPLVIRNEHGVLRDIDVVTPQHLVAPDQGPHNVDTGLNYLFRLTIGNEKRAPSLWDAENCQAMPIDPQVIRRQSRWLEDIPVHTFKLSTHWYLERLASATEKAEERGSGGISLITPEQQAAYDASLAQFETFIDAMREQHPNEFLPEEHYEPFRQLIDQQNGLYINSEV